MAKKGWVSKLLNANLIKNKQNEGNQDKLNAPSSPVTIKKEMADSLAVKWSSKIMSKTIKETRDSYLFMKLFKKYDEIEFSQDEGTNHVNYTQIWAQSHHTSRF